MGITKATPHNHEQLVASDVWTVVHNMGVNPVTDVMINHNGLLTKIIPKEIRNTDLNTTVISFTTPHTGNARLV